MHKEIWPCTIVVECLRPPAHIKTATRVIAPPPPAARRGNNHRPPPAAATTGRWLRCSARPAREYVRALERGETPAGYLASQQRGGSRSKG